MTKLADQGFLDIAGARLEYRMIGPRPDKAPTLVLLHEGMGAVATWGDFPEKLAAATGLSVLVYSREGHGKSSKAKLPRPISLMHDEAREVLPRLLDAIGFRSGLLVGYSDGGTIAAIYAGSFQDHRVLGIALVAAHFFLEDVTLDEIRRGRENFEHGDLREKLKRWHDDPDTAYGSWAGMWLDPGMAKWNIAEELAHIRVPILILQGEQDQYGTVKQVEMVQEECYCPVDVALLPDTRHAPHREAPDATLKAVTDFVARVLRNRDAGAFKAIAG